MTLGEPLTQVGIEKKGQLTCYAIPYSSFKLRVPEPAKSGNARGRTLFP